MVATVLIREKNGAGETATDKTSGTIRFKNADNATVDNNNPMVIPGAGSDYSYEKYIRLQISAGTFTEISNLRAYTDGANGFGTGITVFHEIQGSYVQPVERSDTTGLTDLFGLTSGAPGDMDATNTGPFDSTGLPKDIGDYLVMTMLVASTASQGALTPETLTFAYEEI